MLNQPENHGNQSSQPSTSTGNDNNERDVDNRSNREKVIDALTLMVDNLHPIAGVFIPYLDLIGFINLCVMFPTVGVLLREQNNQIRLLKHTMDIMNIFPETPTTDRLLEILDRIKPKRIIIGHHNKRELFGSDILLALRTYKKFKVTLVIRNKIQAIDVIPFSTENLTIIVRSGRVFMYNVSSVLRSVNEALKTLTLQNVTITNPIIDHLHNFKYLTKLCIVDIKFSYETRPTRLAWEILNYHSLVDLRIKCVNTYTFHFLNIFNPIILRNVRKLQNLENLELTLGSFNFDIGELTNLPRLKTLRLYINIFTIEIALENVMRTLQALDYLNAIWIEQFSNHNTIETIIQQQFIRNRFDYFNFENVFLYNYIEPFDNFIDALDGFDSDDESNNLVNLL